MEGIWFLDTYCLAIRSGRVVLVSGVDSSLAEDSCGTIRYWLITVVSFEACADWNWTEEGGSTENVPEMYPDVSLKVDLAGCANSAIYEHRGDLSQI